MRPFCTFCQRAVGTMYLVNPEGGYGQPEVWACWACMAKAEPGSIMADKRDRLYSDDFPGWATPEARARPGRS